MSEQVNENLPAPETVSPPDAGSTDGNERRHPQRPSGRQKRGGRTRSAYAFPDDLERCFCRSATHVPPKSFPVFAREGPARPAMVELARTETKVLFCDLLHDGPHMWPDGDEFSPD